MEIHYLINLKKKTKIIIKRENHPFCLIFNFKIKAKKEFLKCLKYW